MEVQRLAASFSALLLELKSNDIGGRLSALADAAIAAAQNPADTTANSNFVERASELRQVLRDSKSNFLGPSVRRVLRRTGFDDLVASELLREVDTVLESKPFLLAQAAEQLRRLAKSVKTKISQIDQTLNAMSSVAKSISPDSLPSFELGVMLPTQVVQSDLRKVNDQLKEWIRVIDAVVELTEGQPNAEVPLTAASAGSFEFFVELGEEAAVAFLVLIGGVVKIFTSVLDASKRREEMASSGYPNPVLEGMRKHEDSLLETAKDEILQELMRKPKVDSYRQNELRTLLKHCIEWVLKSMNSGVDVEVNVNRSNTSVTDEADTRLRELQARIDQLVLDVNRGVMSLPSREKPLLQLPHPTPDNDAPTNGSPQPPAKEEPTTPRRRTQRLPKKSDRG